jgi:hypothetical protein
MTTAIVTLPSGQKAQVTFDRPEQLDAVINDLTGRAASAPAAPAASFADTAARQVGLGTRATIEGLASPLTMVNDALGNAYNLAIRRPVNALGGNLPEFTGGARALSQGLTAAGMPTPATPAERIASDAVRAGSAALVPAGIATQAPGAIAASLAARPLMQAASGMASGASAGAAREAGAGPLGQTVAGMVGGFVPYTLAEGAKVIGRGVGALAEPFYEAGREKVIGRTLNRSATDAETAIPRLAAADELVPGSKPTVAQASQDYGLIGVERSAKASNPAPFAERSSDQNLARQDYLTVAAKTPQAVVAAEARRDAITAPLREQTFAQAAGKPVDTQTILGKVDTLLKDPENAGEATQRALNWAKNQIEGKTDARALYAVRKDINRVLEGKYVGADEGVLRYAGSQLAAVKDYIDQAITSVGGQTWNRYLTKYAQLSRPIERMQALQEAQTASSLAAPDARTGVNFLSQAKWKNQVAALADSAQLTKGQTQRIQAIADDLGRGAAINDPNIRAIGSNTTQDLTAANLLGQAIGSTRLSPLVQTLVRPLQWIYKIPERDVQNLLTQAMLDPKMAAELMQRASPAQMAKVSALLRQRFIASAVGTAAASGRQQQAPAESTPAQ